MTTPEPPEPTAPVPPDTRERAAAWARGIIEGAPWASVADRLTAMLVAPAAPEWAPAHGPWELWLVVDDVGARALPGPLRDALRRDGVTVEHRRATSSEPATAVATFTVDALARLVDGTGRRSLEARWSVRHARVLHDRPQRHDMASAAAGRLPAEALERVVRTLFLQAVAAVQALAPLRDGAPLEALPAAGEAAAALARLACVLDEGTHPPVEALMPAAGQTHLGRRLSTWFDDLPRALAGDEAAARRAVSSGEQVLGETDAVLAVRWRERPWLRDPETYVLRSSR